MNSFDYDVEVIGAPALDLSYFLVPWDSEIFGAAVAEIKSIRINDYERAPDAFLSFTDWCATNDVCLCGTRLPHTNMGEILFLEDRGFRFIELSYQPNFTNLQDADLPETDLVIRTADEGDAPRLIELAGKVFSAGRFHDDPRIGPQSSNRRYAVWMKNSLSHPRQCVRKIMKDGQLVGFFVTEDIDDGVEYWWLTAIAPEFAGRGLGKAAWIAEMIDARERGAKQILTQISSHNTVVHNLYVSLGFRFLPPTVALHWLRSPLPPEGPS